MQRRTLFAGATLALLIALPLASAEWRGRGYYEPDTVEDRDGGSMFPDPDVDPNPNVRQAYLAVAMYQDHQSANPNSAALGSSFTPYPTRAHALLGIWKDCNQDGYIGQPEGLLIWYPSQLLPPNHVCPSVAVDYRLPNAPLVHNDGEFVREFFSIGPDDADQSNYEFNLNDTNARVWGDWNKPESGAFPTCPLRPIPYGTLQSTGGFLRYADCHTTWRATDTVNALSNLTGTQAVIGFHDAPRERPDQSDSELNRPNPWGQPSDDAMVTAYDCDADPIVVADPVGSVDVEDPTGGSLGGYGVHVDPNDTFVTYAPGNFGVNPDGSPAGTVNGTVEEGALGRPTSTSNCDREDDPNTNAYIYGVAEASHEGVTGARSQSDFYFNYAEGSSSCGASVNNPRPQTLPMIPAQLFSDDTCGIDSHQLTADGYNQASIFRSFDTWFGNPSYTASRNPYVNKETLQPWGGSYATFYAFTSLQSVSLPPAAGTYGSAHCAGTAPTTGLWQCDPSKWWLNPDGSSMLANENARQGLVDEWRVTVGHPWNLRDIDCQDFSPASAAPAVSLSVVGETSCVRP